MELSDSLIVFLLLLYNNERTAGDVEFSLVALTSIAILECRIDLSMSFYRFLSFFLGATKHLYNWLYPSVGLSVCLSVG